MFFEARPAQAKGVGVVGIDPDTHFTSWVELNIDGTIVSMGQTDVDREASNSVALLFLARELEELSQEHQRHSPYTTAWIESQKPYMGMRNVQSLLLLAQATGMAFQTFHRAVQCPGPSLVLPQEWKGSVPKEAHQARIIKRSGLSATKKGRLYRVDWPFAWACNLITSRHSHLIDALGIAQYGLKVWKESL